MLSWLGRRERARQIEAEANTLVRDYGQQAYAMARRREDEASSVRMSEQWIRIARAVACKTETRVGPDASTREINANAEIGRPTNEPHQRALSDALSRLEKLERI
jgi:hypothetical protein